MNKLNKILKKAEEEKNKLGHPYVGSEHLMLAILSKDNDLTNRLKEYNLTYNKFKRKLISFVGKDTTKSKYNIYTPMLRSIISNIEEEALESNKDIDEKFIFEQIISEGEGIAIRVIIDMGIDINEIDLNNENELTLNDDIITEREEEINNIIQILMRKNKCNPILIGDAGVGKTAIVEEIARRIKNNKINKELKDYKITKIDLAEMVAGSKYRGDFEEKMHKVMKNAENTKTILFIDEIHTLVKAGGAEGAIAAGDIVKPYLARGKVKCIGATTTNEYHEYFCIDEALTRRFQPIIIKETNKNATLNILNNIKNNYEKYHNLKIDDNILETIVDFSIKYQINKNNPDKSIEMLDSICTHARFNEQDKVTKEDLFEVYYDNYGIDLKNDYIRNVIDKKQVLITDNLSTLKDKFNKNSNIININCLDYKNDLDLFDLLGNPNDYNHKNFYTLKKVIDYPLGIVTISNYNSNKILTDFIENLINKRKIVDNLGHVLNFSNYLIILEDNNKKLSIGFTPKKDNLDKLFVSLDKSFI